MTTNLHISTDLALPADAVSQKLAFLGRTGSGKTYGAMKLCELMLDAGRAGLRRFPFAQSQNYTTLGA